MAIMPVNQFSMLAGPSGCGKTTLIMQMWAEHEQGRGGPIKFDKSIKTCGLIIADRTKSEAEERAAKLGIKDMEIYGLVDDHTLEVRTIDDPDELWRKIVSRLDKSHGLLIIDPVGLFMEGSLIDYRSVAKTLIRFNRFASTAKKTMMGIHHTTKSRSDYGFMRPQDRISGSGAFLGYSSTQCMMIEGIEQKETKDYDTLVIVPHMTPKEEYRLVRRDDGYFSVLEDHAKSAVLKALDSIKEKFMRLIDLKNLAITHGMNDDEFNKWLSTETAFQVDGDYVRKS